MFKFLSAGKKFNKMAMVMNQSNILLKEITFNLSQGLKKESNKYLMSSIAFMFAKGVNERMSKYNWGLNSKIIIPSIASRYKPFTLVYSSILGFIYDIARELDIDSEINEILEKRGKFLEIGRGLPTEFLKNL